MMRRTVNMLIVAAIGLMPLGTHAVRGKSTLEQQEIGDNKRVQVTAKTSKLSRAQKVVVT